MDIAYLKVTNKEWFELSLKTVKKYIKNRGNIYVIKSDEDLSNIIDIIITNQTLFLLCFNLNVNLNIMIIDLNVCCLTNINPNHLPITYTLQDGKHIHDHIKPQIILKSKFLQLSKLLCLYPLSQYYNSLNRLGIPDDPFTVVINKPICCTIKSLLLIKPFALFNLKGFNSMKKYINKKILLL